MVDDEVFRRLGSVEGSCRQAREVTDSPGDAADFVGVKLPDRYLYGYGLEFRGYFRNADGVYAVADEDL